MFDETLISRFFIILCCFNFPPMDVLVNVNITWAFITGKQNTFLELKNNKSSIFMWFSNFKRFQKGHFIKHKPLISNDYTK